MLEARRLPFPVLSVNPCLFSVLSRCHRDGGGSQCEIITRRSVSILEAGKRELEERIPQLLSDKPFRPSQNTFPPEAGHFFLKVHDSLEPGATIVKLGRVHGKLLGERSDLQCDQIIDLAPEGKEALLSHRINCSSTLSPSEHPLQG